MSDPKAVEYWLPLVTANIGASLYLSGSPMPNEKPVDEVMPALYLVAPRSRRALAKSRTPYWALTRNEPKSAFGLTGNVMAAPACSLSMTPMLKPMARPSEVCAGLLPMFRANSGSAISGTRISGRSRNELQLPVAMPPVEGAAVAWPAGGGGCAGCALGSPV